MSGVNRKTLAIVVALLATAVIAVSVLNMSSNTLGLVALIGFMFLMYGGHGEMHGEHQDDTRRDEHA